MDEFQIDKFCLVWILIFKQLSMAVDGLLNDIICKTSRLQATWSCITGWTKNMEMEQ